MTRKPSKRAIQGNPLLIILLLILSITGALFLNWDSLVTVLSEDIVHQERAEFEAQISQLEQKIQIMSDQQQKQLEEQTKPVPPESSFPAIASERNSCRELDDKIQQFFSHLDEQEYIKKRKMPSGSYQHFEGLINELLTNPPIVARETDSLFTILTNTAHFYRVLGKENVLILKEIMTRESGLIEPTLAIFDQWSRSGNNCPDAKTKIKLPIQNLYEYSGFFLKTLGGQAYLFRRSSRLRLLIKYYSVVTLDRANASILNRHGIDIIPPLNSLVKEMEVSETLVYKNQYLKVLYGLQEKYRSGHGGANSLE